MCVKKCGHSYREAPSVLEVSEGGLVVRQVVDHVSHVIGQLASRHVECREIECCRVSKELRRVPDYLIKFDCDAIYESPLSLPYWDYAAAAYSVY